MRDFEHVASPSEVTFSSPLESNRLRSTLVAKPIANSVLASLTNTVADPSEYSLNGVKFYIPSQFLSRASGQEAQIKENGIVQSGQSPGVLSKALLLTKLSHKAKKRIELVADVSNLSFSYRQVTKVKSHDFYIDDIRQVGDRELARHFREELGLSLDCEHRWISITYFNHNKQRLKTLHLVADSSLELDKLLSTIAYFKDLKDTILKTYLIDLKDLENVRKTISSEKTEKKQLLLFEEAQKYCKKLDINLSATHLRKMFNTAKPAGQIGLDFEAFKRFVKLIRYRDDLSKIWKTVADSSPSLSLEKFKVFMLETQRETLSIKTLEAMFQKFCQEGTNTWSLDDFNTFLMSRHVPCVKEPMREQNYYNHPLNEYYILSSHNTYLLGRQFAGECSVAGYIRALQRGCRCIEIDIWNNEADENDEPIVNHGRTFTKGIRLSDVLETVQKYAFISSNLPVILSLEVHCTASAQKLTVDILKKTFGSMLIVTPITKGNILPTPLELLNKIIVKVKKTSHEVNAVDDNGSFTTTSTTNSFSESAESSVNRVPSNLSGLKLRKRKNKMIISDLSNLGIYCQGVKFRNFSLPESKTFNHCFSLNEKALNSMLKDPVKAESVDKHNRRFFMRIYPFKFRLSSSNFNPVNYWAHGVQMVATNWQTYDLGQQLNEAFFEGVCGNGYVLKPLDLRRPTLKSTMRKLVKKTSKAFKFKLSVISAQQLHKPLNIAALNPYVTVEIFGAEDVKWDDKSLKANTNIIAGNGFNPIWNEQFLGSFSYGYELVFLKMTVYTSANTGDIDSPREIGLAVYNIFDLKVGYRYLSLRDSCGELLLHSTLFVHINLDQ